MKLHGESIAKIALPSDARKLSKHTKSKTEESETIDLGSDFSDPEDSGSAYSPVEGTIILLF